MTKPASVEIDKDFVQHVNIDNYIQTKHNVMFYNKLLQTLNGFIQWLNVFIGMNEIPSRFKSNLNFEFCYFLWQQ